VADSPMMAPDGPENKFSGPYELLAALALIVCVAVCFWLLRLSPENVVAKTPGIWQADMYCAYVPALKYLAKSVRGGELLLWNQYQDLGKPFLAYPMGAFYPPCWLYLVLPLGAALQVLAVLHLAAAGIFLYWFCRTLKLAFVPSLAAGFSFMFCGLILHYASWTPIHAGATVWVPLAFVCLVRLFRDETYGWAVALAATCTVQILAGFSQFSLYMYYALGGYTLVLAASKYREKQDWRPAARLVGLCVGALVLGTLAASVQLVPLRELAGESLRQTLGGRGHWRYAHQSGMVQGIGAFARRVLVSPLQAGVHWAVAWPSLVAGLAGLFHRKRRDAAFFGVLVVTSLLLARGPGTTLYDWFTRLPTGNIFSKAERFSLLYSFGIAVLVGMGLDMLAAGPNGADRKRGRRMVVRVGVVAAYAIVLALCATQIPGTEFRERVWGTVVCAAVAAAVSVRLLAGWRLPWRALSVVCALLVTWQLGVWFRPVFSSRVDETVYEESASTFEYLKQRQGLSRATIVTERPLVPGFAQKLGGLNGVYVFGDYDALQAGRVSRYLWYLNSGKMVELQRVQGPRPVPGMSPLRLLNLVGVKHVVVPASEGDSLASAWEKLAAGGEGSDALALKLVFEDADVTIYENRNAMPRAYFVPEVQLVTDEEDMLQTLASPEFDARRCALVEDRSLLVPQSDGAADAQAIDQQEVVEVEKHANREVLLRVKAPTAGFVVLTDLFYTGWRAEVDGTRAEIHRANYLFRMVRVGRGEHYIRFVYPGSTFYVGVALSACAVAIVVVFLVVARRVSRQRKQGSG